MVSRISMSSKPLYLTIIINNHVSNNTATISLSDLEGLNEGPQKVANALRAVKQLYQTQDTEESEEGD